MKFTIGTLIIFLSTSCSQKITAHNSLDLLVIADFINQPSSKIQQQYPNLKLEEPVIIDGKPYTVGSLNEKGQQALQILLSPSSNSVLEIIRFPINEKILNTQEYPNTYKPKCESEPTLILFDKISNRIALIKNETIIFHGRSLLIQERINDDKNQKCLNRWGH